MIGLPAGTQVWLAAGHTDMRKGFEGLCDPARRFGLLARDLGETVQFAAKFSEFDQVEIGQHVTPEEVFGWMCC